MILTPVVRSASRPTAPKPERVGASSDACEGPTGPPPDARGGPTAQVVDTTEIRWFAAGAVPADTSVWFHRRERAGSERTDTYYIGHRGDVGFKLRSQRTPEYKVRLSPAVSRSVGEGLQGQLEVWRKWSPAGCVVGLDQRTRWVDVHKTITKRRFTLTGDEILDADLRSYPTEGGVDAEVVEMVVVGRRAWSFAFAAFGPVERRVDAIRRCWQTLVETSPPTSLSLSPSRSYGYPAYLGMSVPVHDACSATGADAYAS